MADEHEELLSCGSGWQVLPVSPYLLVFGDDRVRGTPEQMMLMQVYADLCRIVAKEKRVHRGESGESSHAVSEYEVLGTEIVVRSAPSEDVRSAPLEDVINQETEIGSDEGEVVDNLKRCASSAPEIVADDVVGEGIGHLEEEMGVENVGTGEKEVGVKDVGNLEADKRLDNIAEGDDERDCDDERVKVDSWIDSDEDCLGDSDGEDWGCGNGGTEGVVDVEIDVDYGQGKSNEGLGSGEVGPSSQNHDSEDSDENDEMPSQPTYGIGKLRPKMQIRRPPRPS
ncbi:hypothetical protein DEO72_LG7g2082 [Vigna unguiculata]|uniref:Uncharacterized protein n=1 Tax=Vigna unguiculata TaxID=3917 RepID=A0A4D6MJB1_VIGUN|nr:hypothetical protein DEO72_LG7g2082 [Vigna unguiculata]